MTKQTGPSKNINPTGPLERRRGGGGVGVGWGAPPCSFGWVEPGLLGDLASQTPSDSPTRLGATALAAQSCVLSNPSRPPRRSRAWEKDGQPPGSLGCLPGHPQGLCVRGGAGRVPTLQCWGQGHLHNCCRLATSSCLWGGCGWRDSSGGRGGRGEVKLRSFPQPRRKWEWGPTWWTTPGPLVSGARARIHVLA